MSYKVLTIPPFDKQIKRLLKKYPSLKREVEALGNELSENPKTGVSIGNNCYKIRLAIASKGKGKSGGARVITHIHIVQTIIYLLTIYDKSEQEDISNKELERLLEFIS